MEILDGLSESGLMLLTKLWTCWLGSNCQEYARNVQLIRNFYRAWYRSPFRAETCDGSRSYCGGVDNSQSASQLVAFGIGWRTVGRGTHSRASGYRGHCSVIANRNPAAS